MHRSSLMTPHPHTHAVRGDHVSRSDSLEDACAHGARPVRLAQGPAQGLLRALLSLALLAIVWPTHAQAITLVSNTGQANVADGYITVTEHRAQQFTTGNHAAGYALSEVVADIGKPCTKSPAFALHESTSDSNGLEVPDAKLVDLIGSIAGRGETSFTPDGATRLTPSTKYFVVFKTATAATRTECKLKRTLSPSEDDGASPGWDIAEHAVFSSTSGATWTADPMVEADPPPPVQIAIKGTLGSAATSPVTAPGRPERLTATPGNGEVILRWNSALNNGGSTIIRYEYRHAAGDAVPSNVSWHSAGLGSSRTVAELSNAQQYVFEVRAVNRIGAGQASSVLATPSAPERSTGDGEGDADGGSGEDVDVDGDASNTQGDSQESADTPLALSRAEVIRDRIRLTFDSRLDGSSVPDPGDFQVMVERLDASLAASPTAAFSATSAGAKLSARVTDQVAVKSVELAGRSVVLTLDRLVGLDERASISYTPGENPAQSLAGQAAATITESPLQFPAEPRPLLLELAHSARTSLLRIINHSNEIGDVQFVAVEDSGLKWEPVVLTMQAKEGAYLDAQDFLSAAQPASGAMGTDADSLRIEVSSDLNVEVLSYIRAGDGPPSPVHDRIPEELGGVYPSVHMNPGGNADQVGSLRLINPEDSAAQASILGVDEAGAASGEVDVDIPAASTLTLSVADLEAGTGVQGALGEGSGRWSLTVASQAPLVVQAIVENPAERIVNVSKAPRAQETEKGMARMAYFPSASDVQGVRGIVRLINHSDQAGEVRISARDDSSQTHEPLTLEIAAGAITEFDSVDLENGNTDKGLGSGTGPGEGAWRLELASELDIQVFFFLAASDGLMVPMHDLVPEANGVHRVAYFNPGSEMELISRLRLVNPGDVAASVQILGADDAGSIPGTTVALTIPARNAIELSAAELEAGSGDAITSGALADGEGMWRLWVQSDLPIQVVSLVSNSSGLTTNVSSASESRSFEYTGNGPAPAPRELSIKQRGSSTLTLSWSEVEGVRYDIESKWNGTALDRASIQRWRWTSFSWHGLARGDYEFRVRSVTEDESRAQWSPWSEAFTLE